MRTLQKSLFVGIRYKKIILYFTRIMKCRPNRWLKMIRMILGVAIIGMLIVKDITFLHAHKSSDGYVLVHAHPFDKKNDPAPFKMHRHTHAELFLIQNLLLFCFVGVFVLDTLFFRKLKVSFEYITPANCNHCIFSFSSRAPPYQVEI